MERVTLGQLLLNPFYIFIWQGASWLYNPLTTLAIEEVKDAASFTDILTIDTYTLYFT